MKYLNTIIYLLTFSLSYFIMILWCSPQMSPRNGNINLTKRYFMAENREREVRVVNVHKTVDYLNRSFQEASRGLPLAQLARWKDPSARELEGERHYNYQVEMAYFIDNIKRGPSYMVPKLISDCNRLIEDVKSEKEQKST